MDVECMKCRAVMLCIGAVVITATVLPVSCSQGGRGAKESPELQIMIPGDYAGRSAVKKDRIVDYIDDRIGIRLKVEQVPEGGLAKINVAVASGSLPDVVVGGYPSYALSQWIDDQVIIPLDEYIDELPTIRKVVDSLPSTKIDGHYWGYPFLQQNQISNQNMIYRKDWLDVLGLDVPETLDDFYDVMTAFTQDDPDGNGKDDTYGLTFLDSSEMIIFQGAFGLRYSDWEVSDNGTIFPLFESEAYRRALIYTKKLLDDGLLDPEFLLNTRDVMEEKLYTNRVGAMRVPLYRNYNRILKNLQNADPTAVLAHARGPKGSSGSFGLTPQGKVGFLTAVTYKSEIPRKAAAFIELVASPEGRALLQLGIEGVHYSQEGDRITYMEEEREKDGFAPNGWAHPLAWGWITWPLESNYLPQVEANREVVLDTVTVGTENQIPYLIPTKTQIEIEMENILNDIVTQYQLDILFGKIGIDEGIAALKEEWLSAGGDKVLAAVQEDYEKQS